MPITRGALVPALLGCLIAGGTAYQSWQFERTAIDLRTSEDHLSRQFSTLDLSVADLRTAQAGYVAIGQGPDFWMTRFDDLSGQMEAVLSERERLGHPDALPHLTAAQDRLAALRTSDKRARNYVGNDQRLLASDVIFVESLEILRRLGADVSSARDAEIGRNREEAATIREYQLALAGGALVLLLGLILVAGRRRAVAPDAQESTGSPLALQPTPEPTVEAPKPVVGVPEEALKVNEAADVCVDIARLLDGRDLPAILSRTAAAIGAKGVVLWVIDDARETLRPSLAHGYSDRMVQRLGTMAVSADNVTSVACRTMLAQVVPAASSTASGALAVPLIGTSGCVGVLAAEVTGPARDGSTLPLARVIAAQLAAVITPLPDSSAAVIPPAAAEAL